jgi:hypothetical protein
MRGIDSTFQIRLTDVALFAHHFARNDISGSKQYRFDDIPIISTVGEQTN